MATVSTFPEVKDALVTLLSTALAEAGPNNSKVPVSYAWEGVNTKGATVFFGRMPDGGISPSLTISSAIPTMTGGRKQRQESYELELSLYSSVSRSDTTAPREAERATFSILAEVDDLFADNDRLGLTSIQWARITSIEVVGGGPFNIENGFGSLLLVSIEVQARLT